MKIEELKTSLAEMEAKEQCLEVDNLSQLRYRGPAEKGFAFALGERELFFEGRELASLCNTAGINLPFVRKCSAGLKATVFNEFLEKTGLPVKLILHESTVLSILPARTSYVPTSRLVEVVTGNIAVSDVNYRAIDGNKVLDFVSGTSAEPKKRVGDITHCGISVQEHRNGSYEVSVGGYLYRLSCTNGAVTRSERLHRITGRTVDEILLGIGDATRRIFEIVSKEDLQQFVHLDEVGAQDPAALVHRLTRENNVSAVLERRLLDRVPELGQSPSMYDVVNLITNVANDESLSLRSSRLLQEIGGRLTISADHRCPTCKTHLN